MLIRAYLPKIMTALFGGLFIALGIFSFGTAHIFDRVFIAVLIFTAIVCRENINVVSVVVIILIYAIATEIAWLVLSDISSFKFLLYFLLLLACYICRLDKITKIIFPVIILMLATDAYWYFTNYSSPKTIWYMWLIISTLGLRYLLMYRVSFVDQYFPDKGESINLDWVIYKITATFVVIQILMLLEYFARHILNLPNILIIYTSYPYLIQVVSTFTIWVVFHESYKLLLPKLLKV